MNSWELGLVGALTTAASGLLIWRKVADLLWSVDLRARVAELLEEHEDCPEAHPGAIAAALDRAKEELLHSRADQLEPIRSGIQANATAVAKVQDLQLDPSQKRRVERFFEAANGASELHNIRNAIAPIAALPGLLKRVDQMQTEIHDLKMALTQIQTLRERKVASDEKTDTELAEVLELVRRRLGDREGN